MRRFIFLIVCVIASLSSYAQDTNDKFEITDSIRQIFFNYLKANNVDVGIYEKNPEKLDSMIILAYYMTGKEHLKFMGIEMSGPIEKFIEQLQIKKNLKITHRSQKAYYLEGSFTNIECTFVAYPNKDNTIGNVFVLYPEYDNWKDLENLYYYIKDALVRKYGDPIDCKEDLSKNGKSDRSKLFEVMHNELAFYSIYFAKGGNICLQIDNFGDSNSARVTLYYSDSSHTKEQNSSLEDDL